jgi:hypothetical protein
VDYYVGVPETLTVGQAVSKPIPVNFQWADPYGANVSNFDLYIVNNQTQAVVCLPAAGSSNTFFAGTPSLANGTYDLLVGTPDQSLAGKFIKFLVGGDGATSLSTFTSGSIVSPQAFVPGVVTVGAVDGSNGIGNTIESYSGLGPINLPLSSPNQTQAPYFVAPDAVYVDAAGTNFSLPPDGLFHGTSAASPNAAAVAALLRSAFPGLTPGEIVSALQSGATQMGSTVPDGTFGYGRVDAIGALGTLPYPTMSGWPNTTVAGGSSSLAYPFSVTGVGDLRFAISSDNTALIPNTLVPFGSPGVTITPANCGQQGGATACTIAFTPAIGHVGTTNVKVIDIDGANRMASITTQITVTNPPVPIVSVTGGSTQSITVGSLPVPVTFSIAGTGALTVGATSNGSVVTGVVVSSGCGTTTLACTATPTVAAGQSGSATLTITARDAYGQTGTGNASVQVNAPPASGSGGGGGALDLWAVLQLSALAVRRAFSGSRKGRFATAAAFT